MSGVEGRKRTRRVWEKEEGEKDERKGEVGKGGGNEEGE